MKIVVSDLTDFLSYDEVDKTISAVNEFVKKGNLFILATNKAMNYLAEDISMINLNCEYYICNNGAVIFDHYFNVVYRKDIKQELVRPIYNYLLDNENILEAFVDTSHGYVKDTNKCANGIVARPYDMKKAQNLLKNITLKYPEVHGHIDDACMNIIDASVTKTNAIEYLINSYNFNADDIITTGVTIDDLDLLKKYNGYTFENSVTELKNISIKTVKNIQEMIKEIMISENLEKVDEEDYL